MLNFAIRRWLFKAKICVLVTGLSDSHNHTLSIFVLCLDSSRCDWYHKRSLQPNNYLWNIIISRVKTNQMQGDLLKNQKCLRTFSLSVLWLAAGSIDYVKVKPNCSRFSDSLSKMALYDRITQKNWIISTEVWLNPLDTESNIYCETNKILKSFK